MWFMILVSGSRGEKVRHEKNRGSPKNIITTFGCLLCCLLCEWGCLTECVQRKWRNVQMSDNMQSALQKSAH